MKKTPGDPLPASGFTWKQPLRAAKVGAFARIHADLLAFVDEGRHLDHKASLSLGGLGDGGSRRRLEAGLGFDAGLAQVARNTDGPIAGEFARLLREMQIGKTRVAAFQDLAARTTVPELQIFVSALVPVIA